MRRLSLLFEEIRAQGYPAGLTEVYISIQPYATRRLYKPGQAKPRRLRSLNSNVSSRDCVWGSILHSPQGLQGGDLGLVHEVELSACATE
jgi:hypothetical protein